MKIEWDPTHEYEIQQIYVEQAEVTVHFASNVPTISEIVALRRLIHSYSTMPPTTMREFLGECGYHSLGEMTGREAREVEREAVELGLKVTVKNTSYVGSIPFDKTTGCGWLIEDEEESKAIVAAMIAAGIPTVMIEG